MDAVLNIVAPVFAVIAAGYLGGRLGLLGQASSEALNKYVYWFALPALMFTGMAKVDLAAFDKLSFVAIHMGAIFAVFGVALLAATMMFRSRPGASVLHALSCCFANTGYMGIPLAQLAFGPDGVTPALIATVAQTIVCIAGSVILVELGENRGTRAATLFADTALAVVKNPIVMSPLAGIAWAALGPPLPAPVLRFGDLLGATAGPCALFAIGLFLVGKRIARSGPEIAWIVLLKLVVHPAIVVMLLILLPQEPLWAISAILMAALPTGGLVFVVAQRYGIFVERASAAILISTIVSSVTLIAIFVHYGVAIPDGGAAIGEAAR